MGGATNTSDGSALSANQVQAVADYLEFPGSGLNAEMSFKGWATAGDMAGIEELPDVMRRPVRRPTRTGGICRHATGVGADKGGCPMLVRVLGQHPSATSSSCSIRYVFTESGAARACSRKFKKARLLKSCAKTSIVLAQVQAVQKLAESQM